MIVDPFRQKSSRTSFQKPGNPYDRHLRQQPRRKPTQGASGTPDHNPAQGSSVAAQRLQDKLVKEFVESLTGQNREFAEIVGLAKPLADPFPRRGESAGDEDTHPSAHEMPVASRGFHNGKPMYHDESTVLDSLEGGATPVLIEELSEDEVAEAHDAFSRAIAWLHGPRLLMKKARRLATLICYVRPDLAESLPHCPLLQRELAAALDFEPARLALVFGRVFAWCRDAATVGALGIRAQIIAYVIRPDLLDAATNAQIGEPMNNTRAAINKLVQEFRDTFAGIRAPAMRGELTRQRCRQAQLAGS